MRSATRDGALQRIELAQRGDQLLALCRDSGQRHRRPPSSRAVTRKWARRDARRAARSEPTSRHSCVISNGLIVEIRGISGRKQ